MCSSDPTPVVHNYTVTDVTAPTITLTTPPEGAVYTRNQVVNANYSCADEAGGSGLASCVGDVANGAAINTEIGRASCRGREARAMVAADVIRNRLRFRHVLFRPDTGGAQLHRY